MNIRLCIFFWVLCISTFIFGVFIVNHTIEPTIDPEEISLMANSENSPSCLRMFNSIEKYSQEYNIPTHIAYNIAFKETRYMGPFHWNYNHSQGSNMGALGPMQIMPGTSKFINKESVTSKKLKNDIDYNVMTSMKLLNHLHKKYGDWETVCGVYNTGKVIINNYALYCANTKDYKNQWVKLQNQKEEHH